MISYTGTCAGYINLDSSWDFRTLSITYHHLRSHLAHSPDSHTFKSYIKSSPFKMKFAKVIAAVAFSASLAMATLTASQIVTDIKTVTTASQNLQVSANLISVADIPLFAVGSGNIAVCVDIFVWAFHLKHFLTLFSKSSKVLAKSAQLWQVF
jgi:hypothetical protein